LTIEKVEKCPPQKRRVFIDLKFMGAKNQGLTERQKRFAEAYASNGGHSERAAIQAGYSKAYARAQSHRLLADVGILAYIASLTAKTQENGVATAIARQTFWTRTMQDTAADMQHRLKASELLGRSQGDFIERINGEVRVRIVED